MEAESTRLFLPKKRHLRKDVRRTSKQRGRPVRPKGVAGMPLGAVAIATGGIHMQRKSPAVSRAYSLLATSETNLFVERSSNVNSACNCATYHRVVTDAEESHHLNVCWN